MRLEARDAVVALAGAEVVRGVTLSLAEGEVVGVLGPERSRQNDAISSHGR